MDQAQEMDVADRYTAIADDTSNLGVRTAPRKTSAKLSGEPREAEDLSYLHRRYDEEMRAAATAQSQDARIAHLEMALRYAVRARNVRQGPVWIGPMSQEAAQWAAT